jgi:2-amino-4-hydroxy-6-hydroxymethyldihydropteridine diphosphokinase
MSTSPTAFLALGSNLGERETHLREALLSLRARGVSVLRQSSLYLTEPVGGPPQGFYLNAAAEVQSALSPEALLATCLEVERERGRVRGAKDGPRTLDLDLLLYGSLVLSGRDLELPHPRLHLRRFVLVPLAEIAAEVLHPVQGLSVGELLARCPDRSAVSLFAPAPVA